MDRITAANSTYKKLAVMWLNEALCFVSSSVVADSLVLQNRQLLVAANRYGLYYQNSMKCIITISIILVCTISSYCQNNELVDYSNSPIFLDHLKESCRIIDCIKKSSTNEIVDKYFANTSSDSKSRNYVEEVKKAQLQMKACAPKDTSISVYNAFDKTEIIESNFSFLFSCTDTSEYTFEILIVYFDDNAITKRRDIQFIIHNEKSVIDQFLDQYNKNK